MDWLAPVIRLLADFGAWAPAVFILIYAATTVALAPAFPLALVAGAIFGLWRGTVYVYLGALLGTSAVYFLGAPLARTRLLRRVQRDRRVVAVRQALAGREGVWIMFLLRLSPLVPYNVLNYALALCGVRFRDYTIASVGMIPTIVMYTYYGKVIGDVAVVAAGVAPPRGLAYYAMLVVGLIATVVATTAITRAARHAMRADPVRSLEE